LFELFLFAISANKKASAESPIRQLADTPKSLKNLLNNR
jgi:hypothetical protein